MSSTVLLMMGIYKRLSTYEPPNMLVHTTINAMLRGGGMMKPQSGLAPLAMYRAPGLWSASPRGSGSKNTTMAINGQGKLGVSGSSVFICTCISREQ